MRRREFLGGFGSAAAWPVVARSQQVGRIPKVGVLWHAGNEHEEEPFFSAFRDGLRELGYVEGRNIKVENRFASEQYDRFNALATELVALKVDILVAVNLQGALAAQRATSTIPVVFLLVPDPVSAKLVQSFARPGGNMTGLSQMAIDLAAKRLELFKEACGVSNTALLVNSSNPQFARSSIEESAAAATALQMSIQAVEAKKPDELGEAFDTIARRGIKAVVVVSDSMFWNERTQLGVLSARYGLASMFAMKDHVDAGGMMSYGPSLTAIFRRAASFIDKIIKGEKSAEIPVERPTKFELAVNLKTARALGITIAPQILARADDVIE